MPVTPRSPSSSLLPIVVRTRTSTACCCCSCTLAIVVRSLLLIIMTSIITSSSSFTTTTAFFHRVATTFVPLPTVQRRTFRTTTTWPRRSSRTRIPSLSPPFLSTVRRYSSSINSISISSSSSTTVKPLLLPHLEFVSSTATSPHHHDPVVIFLHGLLGNKRNFASMGRSLLASSSSSSSRVIYSLDLRHHGDSYDYRHAPHQTSSSSSSSSLEQHTSTTTTNADDMSYRTMAQDVIHFCNVHGIAQIDTLIGHSIGGKVAQ